MHADVEKALSAARAARQDVLELRLRSRQARLELQWQRVRAKRQLAQLGTSVEALSTTMELLDVNRPKRIDWRPVDDTLDDVLVPAD
jgi:hypothetical protein